MADWINSTVHQVSFEGLVRSVVLRSPSGFDPAALPFRLDPEIIGEERVDEHDDDSRIEQEVPDSILGHYYQKEQ